MTPTTATQNTGSPVLAGASLVMGRELRTRFRSRLFIVSLLFVVGVIFLVAGLISAVGQSTDTLGLAGEQPPAAVDVLETSYTDDDEYHLEIVEFATDSELRDAIRAGDIDVGVVDGKELVVFDSGGVFADMVSSAWSAAKASELAGSPDTPDSLRKEMTESLAPLTVTALEPGSDRQERQGIASLVAVLMFLGVSSTAGLVSTSITEEKTGNIVELILSSLSARSLLLGKLGAGMVLGLTAFAAITLSSVVALNVFDLPPLPPIPASTLIVALVWFVVGLAVMCSLISAAASLAANAEDVQATTMPVMGVLMLAYFGSLVAINLSDTAGTIISMVPIVSSFAIPGRYLAGDLPVWQHALAFALALGTAALAIRLAERVYVRSVIHTSSRLSWRQALRQEAVR